jgi:surface carbohydrate biosynthesis protein
VPQVKMKTGKYDYNPRVWVLIPIEVKAREYHAKLLLSCVAAEAGFSVILGHMDQIEFTIRVLPRGIVIGNSIVSGKEALFARYRKMGFIPAAWCEEGIAYRNRQSYRHERVSSGAMRQAELFFAWGAYHAKDVRRAIDISDHSKIIVSGSPRLDLLRPEFREFYRDKAERLRSTHGPFVLVNTNFHRFNHYLGRNSYLQDLKTRGKVPDAKNEAFFQQWISFLAEMYGAFVRMLRPLSAALPDHTIVLRPHPSEDHDAWRVETQDISNVKVLHEGSSLPWILASDVVVHNSCATGIEAFAMGVPVVSYRPVRSRTYDSYLPNVVSQEVFNENELVALVKSLVLEESSEDSEPNHKKRDLALQCFNGLEGPLASETIVNALRQLDVPARPIASNRIHALTRELAIRSIPPIRSLLRRIIKGPHPLSGYLHQKFPSLDLSEVQQDLIHLQKVSDRFANINVSELGNMMFTVTASGRKL